jgi:hypothetical protein
MRWTNAGLALGLVVLLLGGVEAGAETRAKVAFAKPPTVAKVAEQWRVAFEVSGPTDVEVAVLDGGGKVVRHLAAGVLGAPNPPPEPLKPGLSQTLAWDGRDDFGKPAGNGPFKVRVRAGTGVSFSRLLGADPYNFGRVVSSAADEDGDLYVLGFGGLLNQGHMVLRVFDKDGRYLREILPFPANLPKEAVKDVAVWDAGTQALRPINRRNLNPDFYGQPGGRNIDHHPLTLLSASKKDGVVLGARGVTYVLEPTGAVRSVSRETPAGLPTQPARGARDGGLPQALRARLTRGQVPTDWNRFAVDYDRDEVYVSDGVQSIWRFAGAGGDGTLLGAGNRPFYAADLAVGYDGLLYVRRCVQGTPGITDFSGPFERYTRDLAPAPYPNGTHVLSKYIYGRYGVAYADRGIGVGPDGTAYISFMYDWVKYCTAGFGPDGKALKGKYLEGQVGNKGGERGQYPPELTSAVIGPIAGANGGLRVDLKGNIYMGMWLWPKSVPVPPPYDKDVAYLCTVGSIFKFTPAGGMVTSPVKDWSSDPIGSTPRTPGVGGIEARSGGRDARTFYDAFVEGAVAVYPGCAPFSHANWGSNSCCVCRAPRFDLDRYGRLYIPNAITNSIRVLDNAGNVVVEFGQYGNFDSQYAPAGAADAKPAVAVPAIPMTWPTGAGVSDKAIYALDTYSRRVVRVEWACAAEAVCELW